MEKKDFIIGVILGLLVTALGCFAYLEFFTSLGFTTAFKQLKMSGNLGKVITLGALLNVVVVLLLFKKNKDTMAKGVILSLFILTIYTLFV